MGIDIDLDIHFQSLHMQDTILTPRTKTYQDFNINVTQPGVGPTILPRCWLCEILLDNKKN